MSRRRNFVFPDEISKVLDAYCARTGHKATTVVLRAIKEYLSKRKGEKV